MASLIRHDFDTRAEPLFGGKKENMRQASREKATSVWVLVLTSAASFMVALDALVVSTALSTIRLHLGASIEQLAVPSVNFAVEIPRWRGIANDFTVRTRQSTRNNKCLPYHITRPETNI